MSYITREDGERFVIPSYRDVITVKKPSLLRREILLLSESYGPYITLQRKSPTTYEVAFSPETGYLLGETVWDYFKRPSDLIYCEEIPNTSEAILVIVKSGSVYLDGSFPIDAIPDELLIFRTQKNDFDVYIYGNVPISEHADDFDKFTLDSDSIKSFNVLLEPIFPKLPTLKAFQLQVVETVLKSKGIGQFPTRSVVGLLLLLGLVWLGWYFISTHRNEIPQEYVPKVNPYQAYLNLLKTPDPYEQVHWVSTKIKLLMNIPGWTIDSVDYADGKLTASVKSLGVRTNILFDWSVKNDAFIDITNTGIFLTMSHQFVNRPTPQTINPLNNVIATLIDSMSYINPGNNMSVGTSMSRGRFGERQLVINFSSVTYQTLDLIGEQFKNLPLVLNKISIKIDPTGTLSGAITLLAYGN